MPLIAAIAAAALIGGTLLIITGLRKVPPPPPRPQRTRTTLTSRWTRNQLITIAAATALGFVLALTTGWVIALLALPAFAIIVPPLLRPAPMTHIELLEAMEEWSRSLAGVLTAGTGLEQAIVATARSTPAPMRPAVNALIDRLKAQQPTVAALRLFADDLNDNAGDKMVAQLVAAAQQRGPGLATVLTALAASVADDVRIRRQIEADRDKPRGTVRWLTIVIISALALLSLTGSYLDPYRTPIGQLVLGLLLAGVLGVLLAMRNLTKIKPLPRFIGASLQATAEEATS